LPLGRALGREFREMLFREWKEGRLEDGGEDGGVPIDDSDDDRMEVDDSDFNVRDHEMSVEERGTSEDSMGGLYV